MNPKYALGFLIVVLAIVSQLVGEDSTIASVANSSDAELQGAMKQGEDAITRAATSNKTVTRTRITPEKSDVTSLSEFYDEVEEPEDSLPMNLVTDEDEDAPASAQQSTSPSEQSGPAPTAPVGTAGRPYEPFSRESTGEESEYDDE